MTRERMQTLGLLLGVNLVVVALFVATRLWLADKVQPGTANALPTLMLDGATAAEMFPPLYHYRPEVWGFAPLEAKDGQWGDDDQTQLPKKSVLRGTCLEEEMRDGRVFSSPLIMGRHSISCGLIPYEQSKIVGTIVPFPVHKPVVRPMGPKRAP